MIRACDRLFTGGILFLIVFTPFAFGAVHPWAYTTMEVVIFTLVIVAMVKLAVLGRQRSAVGGQQETVSGPRSSSDPLTPVALPLALFITLCALQLVPLPPSFLQVISPQTFETYRQILPGWPERMPYGELAAFVGAEGLVAKDDVTNATNARGEALGVRGHATNSTDAKGAEQSVEPDGASLQSSVIGQKSETGDRGRETASGLRSSVTGQKSEVRDQKTASGAWPLALSSLLPAPSSLPPPPGVPSPSPAG